MEIAVFADIHSNYAAFEQCVEYVLTRGIDTFIFLGDYLGEFPYPQRTMEMIYALNDKCNCFFIRGNKEDYWISRRYNANCDWKCGNLTVGAMHYCYDNLTEKDLGFFKNLPIAQELNFGNSPVVLACHGSPHRNNEKMLPDDDKTKQIMEECAYKYILCGHTHIQRAIAHGGKIVLNPGSIGVPLYSGGKSQFMILKQDNNDWTHEFVSIDYDKNKLMADFKESGLETAAPYWTQITKHLMLTGKVAHGTVLARAMQLCEKEHGNAAWYDTPDKYWEQAIAELLT